MSRLKFGFILLTVILLCNGEEEQESTGVRKDVDDADRPKASGTGGGWEKTRLLFLDYTFRGESMIYDVIENKKNAQSTVIEAKYTWETLHHDQLSSVFSRIKFVECISGPCGDEFDDVYISFVQGGNNIEEVYMDLSGKPEGYVPKWNFLLGIANIVYTPAIGGEGDSQFVDSPYGPCQYTFGRPEDKKFRRIVGGCELTGKYNYSRFDGLQVTKYTQDVLYIQNVKLDADIVVIEAVEELTMRSPINRNWGFAAESRVRIEILNRTKLYVDRHCDMDSLVADCALNVFKLTKISKTKYEGIQLMPPRENKFGEIVHKYREHLYEMGQTHTCQEHSRLYSDLLKEALSASEQDFVEAIRAPDNEPVLAAIGNALGSVGNVESLKIAKEFLLIESPESLDPFLFGVANAVRNDEKWHKHLMYWLVEEKDAGHVENYRKIANSMATVLKKRCEATMGNNNACEKGNDKVLNKFLSVLSDTKSDEDVEHALLTLVNLPYTDSYTYARKFICLGRTEGIEQAALQVLTRIPAKFYDSQVIRAVVNVFRDTCPTPTNLHQAKLAVDILLDSVLDHQNAATLLLRGENQWLRDEERWSYFYKACQASRVKDENKDVIWKQMRAFKVFRPNWNQRALTGKSLGFYSEIGETTGYFSEIETSSLYSEGIFQGSSLKIGLAKKKKRDTLFELDVQGTGHDSILRSGTQASTPSSITPKIDVRMGILGHKMPRARIVDGDGDLMAGVWGADGHTIQGFEGNAPIRAYESTLPLLSGLTLHINSHGSMNAKVFGSCEISLWNRLSETHIDVNVSLSFDVEATLLANGKPINSVISKYSTVSSVGSVTDVDFSSVPPLACMQTSRQKTPISFAVTLEDHVKKARKERQIIDKRISSETYPMADGLMNDCNEHRNRNDDPSRHQQPREEL
ncbi:unnamed protein product, partial [Mesorhabditis belari]|uniref:MTP large subunit lipid-binding domain-containing protein n=1 Tax=Mesorhabditis belari TaxID=2138241 RepID=A0AAF3FKP4_9BILA